jgi:hypothetical protein
VIVASSRRGSTPALLAAAAAIATDCGYVGLVVAQNETGPNPGVVPFIVVYIGVIAAAAILGWGLIQRGRSRAAETVLIDAAVGSAALGLLAIFSIGLALVITAGLLTVAAAGCTANTQRRAGWVPTAAGAVLAIAILVGGFVVTGVFWGP